ncbi:MAG: DUF3102 domain-containing protein [Rhodopila sp.]
MARLKPDAGPVPVLLEGDERVKALELVETAPKTPDDYVETIKQLWGRAQSAFLDIGRLLIKAKETLPHGEYTSAVEARLPFSSRTAYQLREATRWVLEMDRRKTISLDRLPGSYTIIYLLSTFDPPTLEAAEQEGIVRPDLRRAELIAWKKGKSPGKDDWQERREKLLREKARIEEELRRLEAERGG